MWCLVAGGSFDRAAAVLRRLGIDAWIIACNEGSDIHSPYMLGVKSHARHFIRVDSRGKHAILATEMEAGMIRQAMARRGEPVDVIPYVTGEEMLGHVRRLLAGPVIAANYAEDPLERSTGFADHVKAGELANLRKLAPAGTSLVSAAGLIFELRSRKTTAELAAHREAVRITMEILEGLPGWVTAGMTEKEVAARIDHEFSRLGEVAFDTIVATGAHSADPHHNSSTAKIKPGPLLVDAGMRLDHACCSDLTWTYWLGGEPDPDFVAAYTALRRAKDVATGFMRAGVETRVPDMKCREALAEDGYDHERLYIHGLGHAIGYEVHDVGSRVSWRAPAGHVFVEDTIYSNEPGLYWEGKWGIRLEDDVIITSGGCDQVSRVPGDPLVI